MAYALGRRMEYYDGPIIRHITNDAAASGYRFGDIVLGVVASDAFRARRVPMGASADANDSSSSAKP
jgi:hypothetical protein